MGLNDSILAEAYGLVHRDRGDAYGHPYDDFTRVGRIWGAVLGLPDVPPDKVALCLIGLKLSRESNRPKPDNVVDIAGYAETLALVRERQDRGRSSPDAGTSRTDLAGVPQTQTG